MKARRRPPRTQPITASTATAIANEVTVKVASTSSAAVTSSELTCSAPRSAAFSTR
ncbi:hypothetical protein [Gordonia alkaliphila]|uniref:hypothetical protein n=1 Tax=Gordonia alkaliphila TaxID=1053547 RepID=UPI0031EB511E